MYIYVYVTYVSICKRMYTVRRSEVRCDNVAEIRQCNRREEGGWQSRECRISSLHHLTISHPTNLSSHHLTPLDITISHIRSLNCLRRGKGWGSTGQSTNPTLFVNRKNLHISYSMCCEYECTQHLGADIFACEGSRRTKNQIDPYII